MAAQCNYEEAYQEGVQQHIKIADQWRLTLTLLAKRLGSNVA